MTLLFLASRHTSAFGSSVYLNLSSVDLVTKMDILFFLVTRAPQLKHTLSSSDRTRKTLKRFVCGDPESPGGCVCLVSRSEHTLDVTQATATPCHALHSDTAPCHALHSDTAPLHLHKFVPCTVRKNASCRAARSNRNGS